MEVWQLQTPEGKPRRYVCRDTYGENCWYWLCNVQFNYCERDYAISDHIVITVCDQSWREITRDSNNRRRYAKSFATLEDTYTGEWRKIVGNYPGVTRKGFREWILKQSFLPLDKTGEGSWQYCLHKTLASETLACFTWVGREIRHLPGHPAAHQMRRPVVRILREESTADILRTHPFLRLRVP